ncbi:cell division protein ZapA [Psychrobacter phenylpyruvicus]|uniref:Cell division protein ZapA n=1 Tax=Psychrobacter phenylpyruvicus TaxID=29432 RepID=A0A379LJN2_9GAMM|nr:cell division protein ZapA [Psychrobacter phenylpyruvicus]SUD90107.1 Z ring-associated protein ZapA [Psychrobacter phenylpyruvicus]
MSTDYPNDYEPQDSEVSLNEQSVLSEDFTEEAYGLDNEQHAENIDSASYDNDYSVQTSNTADLAEIEAEPEPQYSAVDISILDKHYTINCPVGEEHELFAASDFINNFIEDLRAHAPQLPHENLLVLCCLNLYEKLQQTKNGAAANEQSIEQANQLVEQMIQDMQLAQ